MDRSILNWKAEGEKSRESSQYKPNTEVRKYVAENPGQRTVFNKISVLDQKQNIHKRKEQ